LLKFPAWLSAPVFVIGLVWIATAQSKPTPHVPFDATQGKPTFLANCTACHGLDGSGGERAPNIASGSEASRLSDADLRRIVTNGIADAGMPPFHSLGPAETKSVVAYLRILQGKGNSQQMPGDPARGAGLFFGKGQCSTCHTAAGKGGFLAGDLTAYGQGRAPAEIRSAITTPEKDPDQRTKQAVVTLASGKEYRGVIRTEDNFSIVLQTVDGEFVLLRKAELSGITYNSAPLMPQDYASILTSAELNDVVSYLMQLEANIDPAAAKQRSKRNWEED
jgi:putative heme-binding domain-containing protein